MAISSSLCLATAATLRPSTPALPPLRRTCLSALCRFFSDHTLSMSRNHFLLPTPFPGPSTCVGSTRWLPPKPSGLGSLRLAEAQALARPVAAVSFASLSPSRFHLPVPLGSIPITGLLRYYEDSDAFRARFFGPSQAMNAVSLPGSRSPFHLTPPSNHPISNHSRGPLPPISCRGGDLAQCLPSPLRDGLSFSGFAFCSQARRPLQPNRV